MLNQQWFQWDHQHHHLKFLRTKMLKKLLKRKDVQHVDQDVLDVQEKENQYVEVVNHVHGKLEKDVAEAVNNVKRNIF